MNLKNKLFFCIVALLIIFFGGLWLTYPSFIFYSIIEVKNEIFVEKIFSDDNIEKVQTLAVSKSEDERFMAMTGTIIKDTEELNYIAIFQKLPFIDRYHLVFKSIYTGEAVKKNECIMKIQEEVIKNFFIKYDISVYADVILVKSRININSIFIFLLSFLASFLGRKIRQELSPKEGIGVEERK